MAKAKNETKRGPGRPPVFPGVACTKLSPFNVPENIPAMLREMAEKRQEALSQTLAYIIERAHKDTVRRSRGSRKAKPAPASEAATQ